MVGVWIERPPIKIGGYANEVRLRGLLSTTLSLMETIMVGRVVRHADFVCVARQFIVRVFVEIF
jgi:hypothetical protein